MSSAPIWYLDTSAALKLVSTEPESDALAAAIDEVQPILVSALLLETELRRAVHRHAQLTQGDITSFLEPINLIDMPRSLYLQAGLLGGENLRSLDALHLSAAIMETVDAVVTYDHRMIMAAEEAGISVVCPTPE